MADGPHTFRESGARRIVNAVRRVEGLPAPGIASPPSVGAPRESFVCRAVKITTVPGAALGLYSGTLINADFGSPGSAITLNFYHPFEISGGSVLLDVDDIVTIERVDRDSLSDIVGSTVAEGDNWICVGRQGLVVEESDGSPTLLNPRKIAIDQATGVKGSVSDKVFTIKGNLTVKPVSGGDTVTEVDEITFDACTVAQTAAHKVKVTPTGGGGGGGGGAITVWKHTVARFIAGESVVIDSSQDWRGRLVMVWTTSIVIDNNETAGDNLPPKSFAFVAGGYYDGIRGPYGGAPPGYYAVQFFCSEHGQTDDDNIIIAPPAGQEFAAVDALSVVFVDTAGDLRYRRIDDGGAHSWSLLVPYSDGGT